jgi:hypothetical protein
MATCGRRGDGSSLSPEQLDRMRSLFMARQRGALWENFARLWQDTPAEGGEKARAALGLDERPVVLLATNVLGDSLTLGRQVFSQSMAEWISRTVQYFHGPAGCAVRHPRASWRSADPRPIDGRMWSTRCCRACQNTFA